MQSISGAGATAETGPNGATRIVTAVTSTLLAFAGFEHGLFAALQGNRPTAGPFIAAIGPAHQWWEYGGEHAVTLIPNFLVTGLAAMAVSVLIAVWAWRFLERRHGVRVLLALFVLLTLVGGGIGFVPFYLVTCAYATRIDKPLAGWRRMLPEGLRRELAPLWPYALAFTAACWLVAIEIAIFGYFPALEHPDTLLYTCWSFLLAALVGINLSYVSAFAADLGRRANQG